MFPLLVLMGVGVALYAYANGSEGRPHIASRTRHQHLSVRSHRLEVDDRASKLIRHFHMGDLDFWALRSRGVGRPYDIELGFGADRLLFEEGTPGLDDLVDYLLQTPPPEADLSLWGEAMDARRRATFVFLDRRIP